MSASLASEHMHTIPSILLQRRMGLDTHFVEYLAKQLIPVPRCSKVDARCTIVLLLLAICTHIHLKRD